MLEEIMGTLNVGIVGCGRMGTERAAAVEKSKAHLSWFCDTDLSRARALGSKFPDSAVVGTPEEIDWRSVDAVFVCTPPAFRGPVEMIALDNKVPFFIEKPIGLNAGQALTLLDKLKASPIINAVGYMNRYRNSIRFARTLTADRKILGITCVWVGRKYKVPWWGEKQFSGGPFNEQSTHVVDLCRYLAGEVGALGSVAIPPVEETPLEFGVAAAVQFVRGTIGTIMYSCEAREKDIRLTVFCEDGTLDLEGWDFRVVRNSINGSFPDEENEEIFAKETRIFLDAVRCGDQSMIECDLADAYRTQKIVDAITSLRGSVDTLES